MYRATASVGSSSDVSTNVAMFACGTVAQAEILERTQQCLGLLYVGSETIFTFLSTPDGLGAGGLGLGGGLGG